MDASSRNISAGTFLSPYAKKMNQRALYLLGCLSPYLDRDSIETEDDLMRELFATPWGPYHSMSIENCLRYNIGTQCYNIQFVFATSLSGKKCNFTNDMIKICLILTLAVLLSLKYRKTPKSSRRNRSTSPYVPKPLGNVRPTKSELDSRAVELKEMLLQLHTPKYPFCLAVSDRRTKRRLGTYFPDKSRIIVYARNRMGMLDTAIHEYAHHVTNTEIGRFPRCHGKMFKRTYSQLIDIYNSTHQPRITPDTRYYLRNNKPIF